MKHGYIHLVRALIGIEYLYERYAEKKLFQRALLWTYWGYQLSPKIDRNISTLCGSIRASHKVTETDNNGTCNLATPPCKNTSALFQRYQTPSNVSESLATTTRMSERNRGSEGPNFWYFHARWPLERSKDEATAPDLDLRGEIKHMWSETSNLGSMKEKNCWKSPKHCRNKH